MNPYRERFVRRVGHICRRFDDLLECTNCSASFRDFDERNVEREDANRFTVVEIEWTGMGIELVQFDIPKCITNDTGNILFS